MDRRETELPPTDSPRALARRQSAMVLERGAMTGFHDRQPGLADLQREICTLGNLSFKQLHSVVFGRNRKPAAVMVRCGPAFAAHASGGQMSDAPEFGRIRVRVRVWAQALSGRDASRERVCATMEKTIIPRSHNLTPQAVGGI